MRVRQGKKEIDLLPSAQGNAFDAKQDNSMSNCLKVQIFHNRKGKHVVIVRYDISFLQTANSHNHPIFEDNNFLALFIWLHLDSPNESPTEVLLDVARAIRADRNWGTVYLCYISVSRGWNPPTHTHTHTQTHTHTHTDHKMLAKSGSIEANAQTCLEICTKMGCAYSSQHGMSISNIANIPRHGQFSTLVKKWYFSNI